MLIFTSQLFLHTSHLRLQNRGQRVDKRPHYTVFGFLPWISEPGAYLEVWWLHIYEDNTFLFGLSTRRRLAKRRVLTYGQISELV